VPHHVTQRGNRRQATFFSDGDYRLYKALLAHFASLYKLEILTYCLMPNHIHLVGVPHDSDSLRYAIGKAHRQYTLQVNERMGWRGCLWQGRFYSCPMDERHTIATARYIEQNPVRAGLVEAAWQWPWSSAKAHVSRTEDTLANIWPLLEMIGDWGEFLLQDTPEAGLIRKHSSTGRPLGDARFIQRCERITGRDLTMRKPGPPPRQRDASHLG
jgi:putative transposase